MPTCPSISKYNCTDYKFACLDDFAHKYDFAHIPLSLFLCICGLVVNFLNIIVLNQPAMRSSTNLLLASLSFADGFVMIVYSIYVVLFRINNKLERGMTRPYAYALFVCVYLQNLFHAFSSWMIVFLAAFRLAFMRAGVLSRHTCSYSRARGIIVFDVFLSLVLATPFLFAHHVVPDALKTTNTSAPAYKLDFVPNASITTLLLVSVGVFIKGLPLFLMILFSAFLIHTLRSSIKRRNQLHGKYIDDTRSSSHGGEHALSISTRVVDHDSSSRNVRQTTQIMFALIVLYILTCTPQAIMLILLEVYGECFEVGVYEKLGDFLDILTLLNCGGNFIFYCKMSNKFRETFIQLFKFKCTRSKHNTQ